MGKPMPNEGRLTFTFITMRTIKTVEKSINNLKEIQLGIAEMSELVGGKCIIFGSFILPGGCLCDKKDFLAIGVTTPQDGQDDSDA